ncbi:MAG TPA: 6-phosphogluconolactonase [Candidatus Hydrogenedentes bacterium]|nr:6-phosphogluconolactonase [Candidatus Hydrogenedentota bacterium]HQH53672.1 6-phosphogluconolactonase [Candidatus Hydrogenedentota bacterium]HQM51072.1 6-phosphogluconolactonase [Candidatus Hydrogenedentota bacterium]
MMSREGRGTSEFRVCADPLRALARAFAELVASLERPCVALSGGSTPKSLYILWATEYRTSLPWASMHLFQADERCVPPGDPASNWRLLNETLLKAVPETHAYRIEAERPGAAEAYETILRQHVPAGEDGVPRLDLALLGMGADGHTASLFPGTPALDQRERLVVRNDAPQLQPARITLTFPVLEAARHRWFLVTGRDKADAVAAAKARANPAGRLDALWFLDGEAASRL